MTQRMAGWIRRIAFVMVLAAGIPQVHAEAGPHVPLLWKVSDADSAIYLLGSFHLLRASDYPLSADTEVAFDDSDRVLFELSPEEMNSPSLPLQMMRSARRSGDGDLRDDLGPELWARLEAYAAGNGLPLAHLALFDPWFVGMSVTLLEMARQGLDPASGLDRHFMHKAAQAGKPALGLELASEQFAMLSGMGKQEQRQMLDEALDLAENGSEQTARLHAAWRAGDADTLWNDMALSMRHDYPALYRQINVERNDAWLPRLEQELARSDGNTLVVVGALHLLGEDGVVEKLRARGFAVERICSACAVHE